MRFLVMAAAALLLAGCSGNWFGESDSAAMFPPDRPVVARAVPSDVPPGTSCDQAARWRADDVAMQGFDDAVVRATYQAAYADCMKWSAR